MAPSTPPSTDATLPLRRSYLPHFRHGFIRVILLNFLVFLKKFKELQVVNGDE